MQQILEDRSAGDFTSIDFGAAVDRAPSSPRLPTDSPTSILIDPSMLDDAAVLAAARREKRSLGWRISQAIRTAQAAVAAWFEHVGALLEPEDHTPVPVERSDSAKTIVRKPPPRQRSSQWDVVTEIVRERSFKGLAVHDLELDD